MSVWAIARRHRRMITISIVLGVLGAAASLGQPMVIGEVIKAAGAHTSLLWPVLGVTALFCADAGLSAAQAFLIGRTGEDIVLDVRRSLTGRLLRADMKAFSRLEHGDVFTRMVTDTSLARIALSQSLAQMAVAGFMVAGGIALMAWIDIWLLLLTLACLGSASAVSLVLARQVRIAAVRNREDTGAFGSGLQRVLGALTTVKASRAEQRETDHIAALAGEARRSGVRVSALGAMLTPAMNVGTQVSLTVVMGWGMARAATGDIPIADLTAFVMYLFYLVSPLVMLFVSIGQFQQGRAAIQRIDELARLEQEEPDGVPGGAAAKTPARTAPAVEFDSITFGYGAAPVLRDVSFSVPSRGLTAIVGPSGSGKTTAFQLIERFYHPDAGTVRLSGTDVREMPLGEIRDIVGYVEQESALLRGTIRENLSYANPTADEAEIAHAIDLANLTDVIAELPEGLDTPLGERGAGLSGGQRQRLAIARTLLQRPRLVLLDEATSNLDAEAEAAFRRTIAGVSRQCAVVAIAHRISTVVDADHIIVLEGGAVRATGTHEELAAEDELYRRLAAEQLKGERGPATASEEHPVLVGPGDAR